MWNRLGYRCSLGVFVASLIVAPGSAKPPKPDNGGATQGNQVDILFTGRLFGYFRLPRIQSVTDSKPGSLACPANPEADISEWGQNMVGSLGPDRHPKNKLLLGMGDNFALYLPSRILDNPSRSGWPSSGFRQYGKDDFVWDWTASQPKWVPVTDAPAPLQVQLRQGLGVIPTDNVACFLSYAGYDAIVPGEHDFHYGPERVRELARLLASMPAEKNSKYTAVQMLAANLYIKTSWAENHKPIPEAEKPALAFTLGDSDKGAKIKFPADGDEVLPWLYVETQGALSASQFLLLVGPEEDPDTLECALGLSGLACSSKKPDKWQCWWSSAPRGVSCASTFQKGPIPGREPNQDRWIPTFEQLDPGNYKVCVVTTKADAGAEKRPVPYCHRFTVVAPFLQHPADPMPQGTNVVLPQGITKLQNPKPFFFKRVCPGDRNECRDAAVFGVVDPDLPLQVGKLNYAWQNFRHGSDSPDKKMKTALATMDPAKVLKQLVQFARDCYQDAQCRNDKTEPGSRAVPGGPGQDLFMILLAQMDPAKAHSLATRLSGDYRFDVMIGAANYEQFTRDQIRIVDPTFAPDSSAKQAPDPTFVAVPPEAWEPWWACRPVRELRVIQDTPAEGQVEYAVSSVGKPRASASPPGACARTPRNAWQSGTNRALVGAAKLVLPANARHRQTENPNGCVPGKCADGRNGKEKWPSWPDDALTELGQLSDKMLSETNVRPKRGWLGNTLQPKQQEFVGATLWTLLKRTHADVAMMQMKDLYFKSRLAGCMLGNLLALGYPDAPHPLLGGWNGACGAPNGKLWDKLVAAQPLQKTLDILLWKGDFLTVLPVKGSVLEKVLKESDGYEKQEENSILPEGQTGRWLVTLGVRHDSAHDIYYVNDLPIDANRIYTVATTDYIALADTGYPELNDPNVKYPPNPLYSKRKFVQISTLVCRAIAGKNAPQECTSEIAPDKYLDELHAVGPLPETGQTWVYRLRDWLPFHPHSGAEVPGKSDRGGANKKNKEDQVNAKDLLTAAMEQSHWEVGFLKGSLGFNFLRNSRSESGLLANFAGVSYPGIPSPRSHSWTIGQEGESLWSFRWADFFDTEEFDYSSTFTDTSGGFRNASQPKNRISNELGARWNLLPLPRRRKLPHLQLLTSFLFQTQAFPTRQSLSLKSASVPLQFDQGRDYLTLGRAGLGWYDRQSFVEAGVEGGEDIGAIQKFEFLSPQGALLGTCVPGVGSSSLANCVLGNPLILPSSRVRVVREARRASGAFWELHLALPLVDRLTASFDDQGDFFFHNHDVNTTDTRLDSLLTSKLSFQVWPNLAFSPTYELLAYKNQVAGSFLLQHSFGITMDYTFRLTNRRVRRTEFRNKQAASGAQQ